MTPGVWAEGNSKSERKTGTDFGGKKADHRRVQQTVQRWNQKDMTNNQEITQYPRLKDFSDVTWVYASKIHLSRAVPEKSVWVRDLRPYTLWLSVLPGSLLKSVIYSERTLQQALPDICIRIPIWNTLFYTRIQHRMSTSFSESTNVDCWSVVSHIGIPRTMSNRVSSACLSPGPVLSVFFFQRRNQLKGFCGPVLAGFALFYFVEVVLLVAQLT